MAITANVKEFSDKVVDGLVTQVVAQGSKPLYAVVGANELAFEKVRGLPVQLQVDEQVKKLQARISGFRTEAKQLPTQLSAQAKDVQSRVEAQVKALPEQVRALPEQAKGLQAKVEATVVDLRGEATALYVDLSARGEKVVKGLRSQSGTKARPTTSRKPAAKAAKAATKAATKAPAAKGTTAPQAETGATTAEGTSAQAG